MDKFVQSEDFPPPPRWLDEPLVQRLLHRFLDKVEKNQQRLLLRVNRKNTPELYDFQNRHVAYLWELVESLDSEYHLLTIKAERPRAGYEDFENARLYFDRDREAVVRHWLGRPALDVYSKIWEHELARLGGHFEDGGATLAANPVRSEQGAGRTLRAFVEVGHALKEPTTLRSLSARCFWGDSKFLDQREDLIRTLYPQAAQNLLPRPVLLMVKLPGCLQQVVLVENQDSFVALAAANLPGVALVYIAGFRGSALRIRRPGMALFSYLRPGEHGADTERTFEHWWLAESDAHLPCYFWGDLDFAGMAILKALRQSFPAMDAWRAGYEPLLRILTNGGGHHRDGAKVLQNDPGETGAPWADRALLSAMREYQAFVDQEAVPATDIALTSKP